MCAQKADLCCNIYGIVHSRRLPNEKSLCNALRAGLKHVAVRRWRSVRRGARMGLGDVGARVQRIDARRASSDGVVLRQRVCTFCGARGVVDANVPSGTRGVRDMRQRADLRRRGMHVRARLLRSRGRPLCAQRGPSAVSCLHSDARAGGPAASAGRGLYWGEIPPRPCSPKRLSWCVATRAYGVCGDTRGWRGVAVRAAHRVCGRGGCGAGRRCRGGGRALGGKLERGVYRA